MWRAPTLDVYESAPSILSAQRNPGFPLAQALAAKGHWCEMLSQRSIPTHAGQRDSGANSLY